MGTDSAAARARLAGSERRPGPIDPRRACWPTPARPRWTTRSRPRRGPPRSDRCGSPRCRRSQGLLTELLAPRHPPAVQAAGHRDPGALRRCPRRRAILLRGWPGMSPKLRATAAEALFSRPAWIGAFLDAVEKGTIGRADVDPARLELLKSYPDAAVRARAARSSPPRRPGARTWSPPIRRPSSCKGDPRPWQGGLQGPAARRATASKGSASRSAPTSRRSATAASTRCCSTSSTPTAR